MCNISLRSKSRVILVLLWVVAAFDGCAEGGRWPEKSIAVAVDLSGSTKAIGRAVLFGAEFAARKYGVRVVEFDDKNDPKVAIANAFRIAADHRFVAVVGHASSGQTGRAESVYGRFGVPLLMPVATASDLTMDSARLYRRNAFRLVPTNDAQADALTDLLVSHAEAHSAGASSRKSRPTVILAHDYTTYATDLLHKVQNKLKQRSINVLKDHEDPYNFDSVVTSVRFDDVDAVLYVGYYKEAGVLIKQIRGIRSEDPSKIPVPIVLGDGAFQGDLFDDLGPGPSRRDVFLTFPAPDWSTREAVKPLVKEYETNKRRHEFALSFAPFAADAVDLIGHILKEPGGDADPRGRLLKELGEPVEHPAMTGAYRFNAIGDPEDGRYYVYRMSEEHAVFELMPIQ